MCRNWMGMREGTFPEAQNDTIVIRLHLALKKRDYEMTIDAATKKKTFLFSIGCMYFIILYIVYT